MLAEMIVAAIYHEAQVAYILKGWATPPGCQGFEQLDVDELQMHSWRGGMLSIQVRSGPQVTTIQSGYEQVTLYKVTADPEATKATFQTDLQDCPRCDEDHYGMQGTALRPVFGEAPLQGVVFCPNTGKRLFLRPEQVLPRRPDGV